MPTTYDSVNVLQRLDETWELLQICSSFVQRFLKVSKTTTGSSNELPEIFGEEWRTLNDSNRVFRAGEEK
jgi:hypothetical protein